MRTRGWVELEVSKCGWYQKSPGKCRKNPDSSAHLRPGVLGPRSLNFTASLVMLTCRQVWDPLDCSDLLGFSAREAGALWPKECGIC